MSTTQVELTDGYVPLDCPRCGRRRLEAYLGDGNGGLKFIAVIVCEKCAWNSTSPDSDADSRTP